MGSDVDVHWLRAILQKVEQQLLKELRAGLNLLVWIPGEV